MTAYVRPSYSDLNTRIAADLAAMPAVLRGSLAVAWARSCHGEHGHLDWVHKQCSPLACDEERLPDWAMLYGADRLNATAATGSVLATGTVGAQILADTALRGANGLDYTVLAAVTLGAGSTAVSVRCDTLGSDGNLVAGQTLTLIDPIADCDSTLTVAEAGLTGGEEEEDVEDWRARVVDEWRTVTTRGARSGKDEDYRAWSKNAHPSVTGALVQRHVLGLGTVLVRPICNGLTERKPTQAVLDAVAAYLLDIAPATADWRVAAPIKRAVNVSLHLLEGYDTPTNRTNITSAVSAAVLAEESETSLLAMAELDAAIATVTTQYTRLAPTADIAVASGEVLVLEPIVWS